MPLMPYRQQQNLSSESSSPPSVRRAVVLGGGGSRGSYQMGVWQALRELDLDFQVVAGTSVGALNGAMMVQGCYDQALSLWNTLRTENVLSLPPSFAQNEAKPTPELFHIFFREFIRSGGVEPAPLEELLRSLIQEDSVRSSPIDFGLVTVEYPSLKSLVLTKESIPQGRLCDYLLASAACFPAMKSREIDGKRFIDGGYYSNLPIEIALQKGAQEILAVDLEAIGMIKPVNRKNRHIRYLRCYWDLGAFLFFSPEIAQRNIRLGYLDTLKSYGIVDGRAYAFRKWELSPHQQSLKSLLQPLLEGDGVLPLSSGPDPLKLPLSSLLQNRLKNVLMSRRFPRNAWSYSLAAISLMETAGETMGLSPLEVYTAESFHSELLEKRRQAENLLKLALSQAGLLEEGIFKNWESIKAFLQELREESSQVSSVFLLHFLLQMEKQELNPEPLRFLTAARPREFLTALYLLFLSYS